MRLAGKESIDCVIIGNKADIQKREVPFEEGKKLADELHAHFFETSAKTGMNINEAMEVALKEAAKSHPPPKKRGLCYLI